MNRRRILATLALLDADAYRRLDGITRALADGLAAAAGEAGVPLRVEATTGLLTPFFSAVPVTDYEGARACDLDAHAAFCRALLDRGVYVPPSQFEAWFPSLAHTEAHLERTLTAVRAALAEIA